MITIMSMISIMVMISVMAAEGEVERVEEAAAPTQVITLQERQHQVLSGESRYDQCENRSIEISQFLYLYIKCLYKSFAMIKRWPYNWASLIFHLS